MRSKWCVVPQCTSTSVRNPKKMFLSVPTIPKIRKKWLQLAQRDPDSVLPRTNIFMCEDHFDMEKVIANYMQYKLGFSNRFVLAPDALPTKFFCQDRVKPITDYRHARKGLINRPSRFIIQDCRQSQNATDDHVENSRMEPETDEYMIGVYPIVEIEEMDFVVELEESQPNIHFLEMYINQGEDSNPGIVSNEEHEDSPEECQPNIPFKEVYIKQEPQPKVPFEEVYIKQEVDPDLYIVPKEELPEGASNGPFMEVHIKQEPEEDVETLVKDEPVNGFKDDCQPKIQFEAVYIDESAHI